MNFDKVKAKSVWILIGLGTLIAILSAIERHWEWLANLCGSFSSGCHEVRDFTFLSLPIAYWGIAFYLLLALINRFAKTWMFWIVMAASGVEFTFLWLMYSLDMPCLFCLLNAVVMLLLLISFVGKRRVWQALAVCLISFLAAGFVLSRENRQVVAAAEAKSENGATAEAVSGNSKGDQTPAKLIDVDIENSPYSGPEDARVTIVEFSDYMCPSCRALHPTSSKIRQHYNDKVKWVFKDFPLRQHRGAERLAEAARCAWEQGKFWEFQDNLFTLEPPNDFSPLPTIAQSLGMDMPQFVECIQSRKYMLEVIKDRQDALNAGINSTPTIIMNGRKLISVRTEEAFKKVIDAELEKAADK